MGLGGYLAAKTDVEHYASEKRREETEIVEFPERETEEIAEIFKGYGLTDAAAAPVIAAIQSDSKRWVDFMMRFELGLEKPEPHRARWSALTIALSYIIGGLIPLASYVFIDSMHNALYVSVVVTLAALFLFGVVKGRFTGLNPLRGGLQTILIGGLAATAAFIIARLIG